MKDAIVVAAFDNDELIGISTGFPFIDEAENLKEVLASTDSRPERLFLLWRIGTEKIIPRFRNRKSLL